jgi:hypothetical protein
MARNPGPTTGNPGAMNMRPLIGFSLALNFALAAAIFFSAKKSPPPVHAGAVAPASDEIIPQALSSSEIPPSPGFRFRWSDVAADDLKMYRDNLRGIGCPELTVREIIRAVINENFGARRRDILNSFQDQYWDMVLREELVKRQALPQTEWGQALAALAAERQQLLADVLGWDALDGEATRQNERAELAQRRAWLPAEKRARLAELEEKHQQQLDEWTASVGSRTNGVPTPEDEARLQELQKDFDESEKQLLTPAEQAELKIRESDVSDWAANLPGFNPTEDEWRSLTQLRAQLEESQNALAPDLTDEERAARQNELQANFDSAVQAALNPDRLAQYQLANNDEYQSLRSVTQRYGLPDNVASQSLEVQQTAQDQADQVRANPNLSPETRAATLNAIQQETEKTLGQILGSKVLSTYKEYGGDWITGLSQPDAQ